MNKYLVFLLYLIFNSFIGVPVHAQIITTIAGSDSFYIGDGGPATDALLFNPYSVAVDGSGNFYIADRDNNRIRKVNAAGIITTIAGTGDPGYTGDNSAATAAKINYPMGVAVDNSGNVFFTDRNNNCIRKINSVGIINTIAGTGAMGNSGDGGPATLAQMNAPVGICLDRSGNVYVCDAYNSRIRIVDTYGIITTIAGSSTSGFSGDGGMATNAQINEPYCVTIDKIGNLYFTDNWNRRIRKINTSGTISTIAGTGTLGFSGDGSPATSAEFNFPAGIAVDNLGNVYVCDAGNERIREINTSGIISTIAGNGIVGFEGDGSLAVSSELYGSTGVTLDSNGYIYIADLGNNRIRFIKNAVEVPIINIKNESFTAYPNPTHGAFIVNIISPANDPANITITNLFGQIIGKFYTSTNAPFPIQIHEPDGMYIINATTIHSHFEGEILIKGESP